MRVRTSTPNVLARGPGRRWSRARLMGTVACSVSVTAAAVIMLGPDMAGATPKATKTVCHFHLLRQGSSPTDFGFADCPAPFGQGVQYDTFTMSPETPTTGTAVLKFKAYYDDGTVSGVWDAKYQLTSADSGIFRDKIHWTRGTGAFDHVRGSGTGIGTLNGLRSMITDTVNVTGS